MYFPEVTNHNTTLDQGSSNFFCKGPVGKYFSLCMQYYLCGNYSNVKAATDDTETNRCGSVPIKPFL